MNLSDAGPQDRVVPIGLPKEVDGNIVLALLRAANRLILAGGEVIVIGRPDVCVWAEGFHGTHWTSNPEWTGVLLEWDDHSGDQIELLEPRSKFLPYLKKVRAYSYSLRRAEIAQSLSGHGENYDAFGYREASRPSLMHDYELVSRPLLRNRHAGLVASEHEIATTAPGVERRRGRVILLPALPVSADESIGLLLREVYEVPVVSQDAPWLADLTAPGETVVNDRIFAAEAEAKSLDVQIQTLVQERQAIRSVLTLLTLGGTALEFAVRDALRRLGADVEEPVEANKEDGWITVRLEGAAAEGVLEIKSTERDTLGEDGLKQLMQWRERGRSMRGKRYKGILIANTALGKAPHSRPDPFGSGFRNTASAHGLAAMTTATVLRELTRANDQRANVSEFWRRLFGTNGVFE